MIRENIFTRACTTCKIFFLESLHEITLLQTINKTPNSRRHHLPLQVDILLSQCLLYLYINLHWAGTMSFYCLLSGCLGQVQLYIVFTKGMVPWVTVLEWSATTKRKVGLYVYYNILFVCMFVNLITLSCPAGQEVKVLPAHPCSPSWNLGVGRWADMWSQGRTFGFSSGYSGFSPQ